MTFLLLAVLVIALVFVLMQLSKKSAAERPAAAPGPDLANLKVTDAREGDVISITGAGDNFTDLDFTADHHTRFDAGAHPWFELSGAYHERRVALQLNRLRLSERELVNGCLVLTFVKLG